MRYYEPYEHLSRTQFSVCQFKTVKPQHGSGSPSKALESTSACIDFNFCVHDCVYCVLEHNNFSCLKVSAQDQHKINNGIIT